MLKKWPTLLFSLAVTLACLMAFYFSAILAMMVMPADIIYQAALHLPIFLVVSALLTRLISIGILETKGCQSKTPKGRVVWGVTALNLCLLVIGGTLVYSDFTTPLEALIISIVLMICGLAALKKLFLKQGTV